MKPIPTTVLAVQAARAAAAAAIIAHVTWQPLPIEALQAAELVTVLFTTLTLFLVAALALAYAFHAMLGTPAPRATETRPPWYRNATAVLFVVELAALALMGWWFTVAARVAGTVIAHTIPREGAAA